MGDTSHGHTCGSAVGLLPCPWGTHLMDTLLWVCCPVHGGHVSASWTHCCGSAALSMGDTSLPHGHTVVGLLPCPWGTRLYLMNTLLWVCCPVHGGHVFASWTHCCGSAALSMGDTSLLHRHTVVGLLPCPWGTHLCLMDTLLWVCCGSAALSMGDTSLPHGGIPPFEIW